jgi:hypothetical protein
MAESKFKTPTETIELPSRGLIYPLDNPLSSGTIEMKYMGAREEDILTNQNYIRQGIALDKLLESLIVSKVDINNIITGDKNALLIASRILGYGKDYTFKAFNSEGKYVDKTIDLTTLEDKELDPKDLIEERKNEFKFELPYSGNILTFKLLTHGDEKNIEKEIEGIKKVFPDKAPPELSTRLKFIITSVNEDRDIATIRDFVDNGLLVRDSRALRDEIKRVSPDVILLHKEEGEVEDTPIPINLNFFWPVSTI